MKRAFMRLTAILFGILSIGALTAAVEAGTVVRFELNYAPSGYANYFDIELYDSQAPITVANFLKYVNGGLYDGTIFHRNMPDFVVQGGGFTPTTVNGDITGLKPITNFGTIQNEYSPSRSNVAGTVAMAKLPDNVNGASNEWFVNVGNNASNLDNQNGGFTVFGRVLNGGMTLVNAINDLPTYNLSNSFGGTFTDVPLINSATDFVRIRSATVRPLSAFSGQAYVDSNHDGVLDSNDQTIMDAKVMLMKDGSTTPVATAYTDKDGHYSFANLAAGTYSLKMETMSGAGLANGSDRIVVERDGTLVSKGTAGTATTNAFNTVTLGGSQRGEEFNFGASAYPIDFVSARMLVNSNASVLQTAATSAALSALAATTQTQSSAAADTSGDGGAGGGEVVVAGGVSAVPEPGTLVLLALGALSLGLYARRRRV